MTLTIENNLRLYLPWCLVVDTRLNQAIKQLKTSVEIKRIWYPFELNPTMPEAGMERKTYRSNKFGSYSKCWMLKRFRRVLMTALSSADLMRVTRTP